MSLSKHVKNRWVPCSGSQGIPGASVQAEDRAETDIRNLPISKIRRDGQTQHRLVVSREIIDEYAALMSEGVVFQPTNVWFDGKDYWLADGFQRLAAAEQAGITQFPAKIRRGSLSDAQWDSYNANSAHGLRLTSSEVRNVVQQVLRHPKAKALSNVQIAKHLNMPEATLRRWRKQLSSSNDEDSVRIVTRGDRAYSIRTDNIGKRPKAQQAKSHKELREDLSRMKETASPTAQRLLNIIAHWAFGRASAPECLVAIEQVVRGADVKKSEPRLDLPLADYADP